MRSEYRRIVEYLNMWQEKPSEIRFEREGKGGKRRPEITIYAERGGTAEEGGRRFRLSIRTIEEEGGEYYQGAEFFDQIEEYIKANAMPQTEEEKESGKRAAIERRSSPWCSRINPDGSREYSGEYSMVITEPGEEDEGGGEEERLSIMATVETEEGGEGVEIDEANGWRITELTGTNGPEYAVDSMQSSGGEGSFWTAVAAEGRTFSMTAYPADREKRRALLGMQREEKVRLRLRYPGDAESRSSICRFTRWEGGAEEAVKVTLRSDRPWLEGEERTETFSVIEEILVAEVENPGDSGGDWSLTITAAGQTEVSVVLVGDTYIPCFVTMETGDVLNVYHRNGSSGVRHNGAKIYAAYSTATEIPMLPRGISEVAVFGTAITAELTVIPLYWGI